MKPLAQPISFIRSNGPHIICPPLRILLGAVLPVIFLTGCAALHVSRKPADSASNATSVPGVPFYPKKARCRQEIVWFEPIYTVTLTALIPDKDGASQSHPRGAVVLSRSSFASEWVTSFMKLLNNNPDPSTVLKEWQKVVAMADSRILSRDFGSLDVKDRILVSRSAAPSVYVDYSDQYYLNAKAPLSGSANVDVKVANDGSLTEASAQVENKTLDTILNALPIGSIITGGLGLAAGKGGGPSAGEVEAFQLTVSLSGYRHTLAQFVAYPSASAACAVASDIPFDSATEYKREDITTPADTKPADKSGAVDAKNPKTGDKATTDAADKGGSTDAKTPKAPKGTTKGTNTTK